MTVEVQIPTISYAGNGTAAPLAVPFRFLLVTDLVVTAVAADGAETILVRGTHYSVSGAGAEEGGSVTPIAPVAIGVTWRIDRDTPLGQPTHYSDGFYSAATQELGLDRQMLALQETDRDVKDLESRSLRVARGEEAPPVGAIVDGQVLAMIDGALIGVANDPVAAEQAALRAEAAEEAAQLAEAGAEAARDDAADSAIAAENSALDAQAAVLGAGYYPGARAYLPQGVIGYGPITPGSGGTDGIFALGFSGGNFAIQPTGLFVVGGGAVTSMSITGKGYYVGNAIALPAINFAASAGLTGAAVNAIGGALVGAGGYYLTDHASDADQVALFQNQADVAVEVDASIDWLNIAQGRAYALQARASVAGLTLASALADQRPNWFTTDQVNFLDTSGNLPEDGSHKLPVADVYDGIPCWRLDCPANSARDTIFTFAQLVDLDDGATFSGSVQPLYLTPSPAADAGTGGSCTFDLVQLAADRSPISGGATTGQLGTKDGLLDIPASNLASVAKLSGAAVLDYRLVIRNTGGAIARSLYFTLTFVGRGSVPTFRMPTKAPLVSPALLGTPTAPTAPRNTRTDQIATTAFVDAGLKVAGRPIPLFCNLARANADRSGVIQASKTRDGHEYALFGSKMREINVSSIDPQNLRNDLVGGVSVRSGKIPRYGNAVAMVVDLAGNPIAEYRRDGSALFADDGAMQRVSGGGGGGGSDLIGPPSGDWQYTSGWFVDDDPNLLTVVIKVGQSWDQGQSKDAGDATITGSPQHPGSALMFDVGTRPDGATVADFVDLHEAATASSYETPLSGIADSIMTLTNAAVGRKPRCLFMVAAQGGTAYYGSQTDVDGGMKRGSTSYLEWTRLLERARVIAADKGWRIDRVIFDTNHGHEDTKIGTSKTRYLRNMEQYVPDARKDVADILGDGIDVRFFCAQVNRFYPDYKMPSDVALAQLDPPAGWTTHGSAYDGPVSDDNAHLKALGWRVHVGRHNGYYIAQSVWGRPVEPLRIDRVYWANASALRIQFNKPVTIETTDALMKVSDLGAGAGVGFLDGVEVPTPVPSVSVSSVSVVTVPSRIPDPDGSYVSRADTVHVALSGTPTGREPRIIIAGWSPVNGSGSTKGNRSGIRSTTALLTDALTGATIYDWAAHEVRPIPYRR